MYDTKTEDDTLVLNELDSVLDTEPTLEELDKAADYFEHTVSPSGDKVWTITASESIVRRTSTYGWQQL